MKLEEYVEEYCINVTKFAKKIGVNRNTLLNIMKGETPSLHVAKLIKEATEGKVKPEDMWDD